LFLATISSNLLENCEKDSKNYFEPAGLCLIAAIFSRRFIDTIGKKILKEAAETKEEVKDAKQKIELQQSTLDQIVKQVINALPPFENTVEENKEEKDNDTTILH